MRKSDFAALSRRESEALAGEILAALGTPRRAEAAGGAEPAEASPAGVRGSFDALRPDREGAGEDLGAARRVAAAIWEAARAILSGAPALEGAPSKTVGQGAPGGEGAYMRLQKDAYEAGGAAAVRQGTDAASRGAGGTAAGQDVDSLSDYLRRDARRYDAGIIRY